MHPTDTNLLPVDAPRQHRRFAWELAFVLTLGLGLAVWQGVLSRAAGAAALGLPVGIVIIGHFQPSWLRRGYAVSRRMSEWAGRTCGGFVLYAFYVLLLTPCGFIARRFGYDPLALRPRTPAGWRKVAPPTPLDRLY